jgi:hypothetical protein
MIETAQHQTKPSRKDYPMKPSALKYPPTFADLIAVALPPDTLARLEAFRREMEEVEKISKVPSIAHILVPNS